MRISGRQKRNDGMQISIPTASPVRLAQTGNCFRFQKKDPSSLQWHPNTIGIHLFVNYPPLARASRSLQNLSFFFCSTFNMLNILKKRIFLLLFFRIFCRRFFQYPIRNILHLLFDFAFVRHAVHSVLHLILHILPVRHRIIHIR